MGHDRRATAPTRTLRSATATMAHPDIPGPQSFFTRIRRHTAWRGFTAQITFQRHRRSRVKVGGRRFASLPAVLGKPRTTLTEVRFTGSNWTSPGRSKEYPEGPAS